MAHPFAGATPACGVARVMRPAPHGAAALPRDCFQWVDEPLAFWAATATERTAVSEGPDEFTYRELEPMVDGLVALLAGRGVRGGDRVMIVLENGLLGAAAILACARMRAWAVPVNARLTATEIDSIRAHCRPRALLYAARVSPDAADHGRRHGAEADPGLRVLGGWIASAGETVAEPVSDDPARQVAALIYTTGTTGAPKGVMLTHDNLMFIAGRSSEIRFLNGNDRVYAVLPMSHVFGLASVFLGTLYQGAWLELVPRFVPDQAMRALAEDGITVFQGVPQMYARMVALAAAGRGVSAPRLRYLSAGGAPLDLGLKAAVEELWQQPLHNGYGLTETSPTVSTTETDRPAVDESCGPPIPDVELRIARHDSEAAADAEADAADPGLAAGEIGEIQVRGRLVARGYYRDPEQTAAMLTPGGWLRTGDLGRLSEAGHLYVVGRLKELIIRSGFNVYPPEVEAVVARHPDVALAAVVGRKVPGNEEVVAFVQPHPGGSVDIVRLRDYVERRLAPYKRPAHYMVMDELPASATGKLLKARLREYL